MLNVCSLSHALLVERQVGSAVEAVDDRLDRRRLSVGGLRPSGGFQHLRKRAAGKLQLQHRTALTANISLLRDESTGVAAFDNPGPPSGCFRVRTQVAVLQRAVALAVSWLAHTVIILTTLSFDV